MGLRLRLRESMGVYSSFWLRFMGVLGALAGVLLLGGVLAMPSGDGTGLDVLLFAGVVLLLAGVVLLLGVFDGALSALFLCVRAWLAKPINTSQRVEAQVK